MLTFFKRLFSSGTNKPAWNVCCICGSYAIIIDDQSRAPLCLAHAEKFFAGKTTIPSMEAIKKMHEEWNSETK
jgi:hypothetical protein